MITTKQELVDYALRKLGAPVISIEIDSTQINDRVDEALEFFRDFHYDATERIFLKHKITGTSINVVSSVGFVVGEEVRTPDDVWFKIDSIEGNTIIVNNVYDKLMQPGADLPPATVITGQTSGVVTAVILKTAGDTELLSVPVSDMVTGVVRVIPWGVYGSHTDAYLFDPKYNASIAGFHSVASTSLIYYSQVMSRMSLIDQVLNPIDSLRYNKKMNRVFIDMNWATAKIGSYLLFDCFRVLDPAVYTEIYNDRMLKKLLTAMLKKQWAQNTGKYTNIQLLGGVTVDAATLMAQAEAEIESAETEIRENYELPPIGFIN